MDNRNYINFSINLKIRVVLRNTVFFFFLFKQPKILTIIKVVEQQMMNLQPNDWSAEHFSFFTSD